MRGGLRYEKIRNRYYLFDALSEEESKEYGNLFPSLLLTGPLRQFQLMLLYRKGIQRPTYAQLRQNVYYWNKYSFEAGNPNLKPEYSHDFIGSLVSPFLNIMVGYQHIENQPMQVSQVYDALHPEISLVVWENARSYDAAFVTATIHPTFGLWSPQLRVGSRIQNFNANTPEGYRRFNHPTFDFDIINDFQITKNFGLNIEYGFITRGHWTNLHLDNCKQHWNFSIYKKFLKESLTIQLQGRDIFKQNGEHVTIYNGNRILTQNTFSLRKFSLSVRYRLNVSPSKYKGSGAANDQRNRID